MSSTQQTRRFDHVYDPVYTASGAKDVARAHKGATRTTVDKVPDHKNLFSEIPTVYRPHEVRVRAKQDLPGHIDMKFRPPVSNSRIPASAVTGSNRHKYFRRPVVPVLHNAPPEILLAKIQETGSTHTSPSLKQRSMTSHDDMEYFQEGTISRSVQTRLRESEAQTDPYTPAYIIPEGKDPEPEILTLAGLKYGKGLPATMVEVELIERARAKKKFLASLPPITDEASFNLRKRMMEDQELLELKYREDDIAKMQEEHLRLMKQALHDREAEAEYISEQRIEALRQQKLDQKDNKLYEIQKMRIKQLRKLAKARIKLDASRARKNHSIIDEYSRFSSKTYAPHRIDGTFDPCSVPRSTSSSEAAYLRDYDGLQALEDNIGPNQLVSKIQKPKLGYNNRHGKFSSAREHQNVVKHLEWMDQLLKANKEKKTDIIRKGGSDLVQEPQSPAVPEPETKSEEKEQDIKPLWRRRAEKLVRPPTPRCNPATEDNNRELETAITLLQQLLRGRAIQTMMYEGKMKRLELIRELRTDETLDRSDTSEEIREGKEQDDIDDEDQDTRAVSNESKYAEEAAWGAIQGEVVSSTLDLLSKELVRLQQERQVYSMVSDAVEKRRRREMLQAGTRQAEKRQRDREDEVYRQLMLVHQGTVDSYFDEILANCIDVAATDQARTEVQIRKPDEQPDQSGEGSVVQNLVSSFLLPHVQRETVRSQIQFEERRFVRAAHDRIYEVMKDLERRSSDESKN